MSAITAREIADYIERGYTITQLAAELNVNASMLRSKLSRADISSKAIRQAVLREKAKPMLDSGMTAKAVAQALGVVHQTVLNAVPEHKPRKHTKLTPDKLCEVERLLHKGVAVTVIAQRLGVTRDAIYKRLGGRR